MPKHRPTPEEQKELNAAFERSTTEERARISFVQIDLGELGNYRVEIPPTLARQFAVDFVRTLCCRQKTKENSPGQDLAFNLLSRAFDQYKRNSEGGKKGARSRSSNALELPPGVEEL